MVHALVGTPLTRVGYARASTAALCRATLRTARLLDARVWRSFISALGLILHHQIPLSTACATPHRAFLFAWRTLLATRDLAEEPAGRCTWLPPLWILIATTRTPPALRFLHCFRASLLPHTLPLYAANPVS